MPQPQLIIRNLGEGQRLRGFLILQTDKYSTSVCYLYILSSNFMRIPYFGRSVISGFNPTL